MSKRFTMAVLLPCLAAICAINLACAQTYPARPIRLIVPYPPGATTDATARSVAGKVSERLKQQIVVDNIGGAGGVIAAENAARATPDGYTLLFGTSAALIIGPLLNKSLPYHPVRDFSPISQIVSNPMLMVVNASVPANSAAELIALARRTPGALNYGSAGPGTPNHLATELLKSMAGINMIHVAYRGSAQALIDLVSGRVQFYMASVPGLLPSVKSGKLKAIAVSTARRSGVLPDLPSLSESTVPGYEFEVWYGLFAPARTTPGIISRLNAETVAVLSEPEFVKSLAVQGSEARGGTPEALGAIVRGEYERLGKVLDNIGPITQ